MAALHELPPRPVRSCPPAERIVPILSFPSEATLWEGIGRGERVAMVEVFRRHGEAAFMVARTITQDSGRAQQAVMAALVRLTTCPRRGTPRSLRVEVLDAARRCAGSLAPSPDEPLGPTGPGALFRAVPADARDTLALAVAGRCGCAEIAQVMEVDDARVHRNLLLCLHQARALRGSSPRPPTGGGAEGATR
jgi:hypothetical protein